MGGRDLPHRAHRAALGTAGRPHLTERLPVDAWYPAGVAGVTARSVTLPTGVRVRLVESGPADGPPLLLLHGWAVSSYLWRHAIGALAASGARVIAMDLPGHGRSDAPTAPGSYALARFTAHVAALLDHLAIPRAAVAAQSMGGKVAARLALDAPDRVAALVLFGPVGFGALPPWKVLSPIIPPLPAALAARLVPRRVVDFVQRRVHGKLGWFTERDVDEYWAPTQFPDVVRAQLQMLNEFDWAPWTPEALAALRVPTHVVFGTRDRTVRPVHAETLVAAIPAGRLTWVEDGGHVVMEEAPERSNALILDALREAGLDSGR